MFSPKEIFSRSTLLYNTCAKIRILARVIGKRPCLEDKKDARVADSGPMPRSRACAGTSSWIGFGSCPTTTPLSKVIDPISSADNNSVKQIC